MSTNAIARGCACRLPTSVARNKANTSADSAISTTPLTRTTQLRCGKPRAVTTDAAKVKQVELWRLEKCDVRIKSLEARAIQLEAIGAARECNEEGLCDCFFPVFSDSGQSQFKQEQFIFAGMPDEDWY